MTDKAEEEIAGYYLTASGAPTFGVAGPLVTQPTSAASFDGTDDTFVDGPTGRVYHAAGQPYTFVALAMSTTQAGANAKVIAYNGDGAAGNAGYGMCALAAPGGGGTFNRLDFGGVLERMVEAVDEEGQGDAEEKAQCGNQ